MKETLSFRLMQYSLVWENKKANLEQLDRILAELKPEEDVLVLPEMFPTGFTMNPQHYFEETGGEVMQWMFETAAKRSSVICGSVIIKEDGRYYNRFLWVRPDGSFETYNKRHLFRMGNEHLHYSSGNERIIIHHEGWKICPLVCYDLRFPVWSRNRLPLNGYDILLYVANWPQRRNYAWRHLLIGRAIENQSYCIGVNRIGKDGKEIDHSGNTMAVDFTGKILHECEESMPEFPLIKLVKKDLEDYRESFPSYLDADDFNLIGL